jgi:CubicO group peptidase (beta-lactamase class C family)
MHKFYTLFLLIIASILSSSVAAQKVYFPERASNWETKTPASFGIDADKIEQAVDFAKENEYSESRDLRIAILKGFQREPFHYIAGPTKKRGGPAGVIIKNGYIIAKWGNVNRVDMTFSVTKSYLSTVAGLALDEGLISGVNDKMGNYIWDQTFWGDHNTKISWSHLLNQSSDWSGELFGMKDWADRPPKEGGIDDWKNRALYEPGTHFKYNDIRVNVLSYSLLHVWRKSLPQVLKEKIMDPIGASTTWRWFGYDHAWVNIDGLQMKSVTGGGHSGGGVFINTLDHARFGLLFMNNGNWNGKQLISENWIKMATAPSPANESYGYMWWLNKGSRKIDGPPSSMFYAAGFGGNYVVVDQENELVIVTRWLEPSKMSEMMKLVYKALK